MSQVTMPQLGEGVEQGTIGKWLKAVGDHVSVGDPLVEVVTDKVNAEVPSPFEGTLTRILVGEGETIANDVAIAEVETARWQRPCTPRSDARRSGARCPDDRHPLRHRRRPAASRPPCRPRPRPTAAPCRPPRHASPSRALDCPRRHESRCPPASA